MFNFQEAGQDSSCWELEVLGKGRFLVGCTITITGAVPES